MRSIVALLLTFLASCNPCFSQEVKVTEVSVITGLVLPQVAGPYVLTDKTSKPVFVPGRLVEVASTAANIEVEALYNGTIVDGGQINANSFIIPSIAKMTLRIRCVDFDQKIYQKKSIDLTGPVKPDPLPQPDPDPVPDNNDCSKVPDDNWGIGKKVCGLAKGLPNRPEVALLFDKYANRLVTEPKTITDLTKEMVAERELLLGANKAKYEPVMQIIQNDIASKWPMDKGTFSLYYKALAAGFRGAP